MLWEHDRPFRADPAARRAPRAAGVGLLDEEPAGRIHAIHAEQAEVQALKATRTPLAIDHRVPPLVRWRGWPHGLAARRRCSRRSVCAGGDPVDLAENLAGVGARLKTQAPDRSLVGLAAFSQAAGDARRLEGPECRPGVESAEHDEVALEPADAFHHRSAGLQIVEIGDARKTQPGAARQPPGERIRQRLHAGIVGPRFGEDHGDVFGHGKSQAPRSYRLSCRCRPICPLSSRWASGQAASRCARYCSGESRPAASAWKARSQPRS